MRLLHLSDVHISSFAGSKPSDFLNKRILGGWNLLFGRSDYLGDKAEVLLEALRTDVKAQQADLILISGDLTSLALPAEFARAVAFTESLGGPEKVMVIPGNHDYYTHEAAQAGRFESYFAEYLRSATYPIVRFLGESVAVIGVSSAVATGPYLANGRVGDAQRERLQALLSREDIKNRHKVLALHHPPQPSFQKHNGLWRGLDDHRELRELAAACGVGTILHGHEHRGFCHTVTVGDWRCMVYDAGSATSGSPHYGARYNVYTFGDAGLPQAESRQFDRVQQRFVSTGTPHEHPKQREAAA